MARSVGQYNVFLRSSSVFIGPASDLIWVGDLETILRLVGGPAWTISYTECQKRRYPHLDMTDEGITIDIVDFINGMTIEPSFRNFLAELPDDSEGVDDIPPRTGLFTGRLLEELETGLQ